MMSPTRTTRRPPAFTLIELLVVVAIIALLLSILLPSFGRARDLARSTATQARISSLADGCEMFRQDHGAYPGLARWPIGDEHIRPVEQVEARNLTGSQMLAMSLLDYYWTGADHTSRDSWISMTAYLNGTPQARAARAYVDLPEGARDAFALDESGRPITNANDPGYRPLITGTWRNTILDTFSYPMAILYFVARPGQAGIENIYRYEDNADFGARYPDAERRAAFYESITRDPDDAQRRPYRPDSFLLIAPGIDREWFTSDDNRNFDQ